MKSNFDPRDRILQICRILCEETDERHPIRLSELAEKLEKKGFSTERKSLYKDFAAIQRLGWKVGYRRGSDGGWFLGNHVFAPDQRKMLTDAVQVYPWVSEKERRTLLDKLASLGPRYRSRELCRPVETAFPNGEDNAEKRTALDRIYLAMQQHQTISFLEFHYDLSGKKHADRAERTLGTPKGVLWDGRGYRLLLWDHKERAMRLLRVDRISAVLVMGFPSGGPEVSASDWTGAPFGFDPDKRETVKLRCRNSLAEEVRELFGEKAEVRPCGDSFFLTADVTFGAAFFEWLRSKGSDVTLLEPLSAAQSFKKLTDIKISP